MASFCFGQLAKIPENAAALQSVLFYFKIILECEKNFTPINFFFIISFIKLVLTLIIYIIT